MESETKTKYRIFISYSHEDEKQKEIISDILEKNGLYPISDKEFFEGHGFHDQIKKFIAHAYIFMPVISKTSNAAGWVHEEIGYAMAHNIPIYPIVIEKNSLPPDMINGFQARNSYLKTENEAELKKEIDELAKKLTWQKLNNFISSPSYESKRPIFECAYFHLERTIMLVEYASILRDFFNEQPKLFRQSGGLSSFHIPDSPPDSEDFKLRIEPNSRADTLNKWLREERIIFEEFAKEWGFKIIIDIDLKFEESAREIALIIRKARLTSLLEFLNRLPPAPRHKEHKFEVIIDNNLDKRRNVIIVGDLFLAESLAGYQGRGLRQTMFTKHAPT